MSLMDLWNSMGLFARMIVIVMVLMSLISWTIAVQKWSYLRKAQKETRKFGPEFSRSLQEEQLDSAIKLAEKSKKSHVARVLGEALAEVKPLLRDRATITAGDINSAERAAERPMLILTPRLKRGPPDLPTHGPPAPSCGRFGPGVGGGGGVPGMP